MKHIPSRIKDKYEILDIIGEGAYGVVLKARKKETNTVVAIKHFKQNPGYCSDTDLIDRELKILQSLRFENIVELIEWFRDKKQCFLVFEYVEWNMLQVLQKHPTGLNIEQVRRLSYELFSAIHWCHIHEIIHRDIKPENLLISKDFNLKLCDFGFARFCNTQTTADYYTDYVATRWYRSPELLIGLAYGKPVDVWACGCIMAELATGQALFAGESDIDQLYRIQKSLGPLPSKYLEAMKSNSKFEGLKFPTIHHLEPLERRFDHIFPQDIIHLFKNTLRLSVSDRYTAEKCVQHEAFTHLHQKRLQRQYHQPKILSNSSNTSQPQIDHNNGMIQFTIPVIDHRLSKSCDENNNNIHNRYRSQENFTDTSFLTSSSVSQQMKYRSNTQLNDYRQQQPPPKIIPTHTSTSTEINQPVMFSPRSQNDINDNDDDSRRKYLKIQQQQQIPPALSLKYASNGIPLRLKQQYPMNISQTSSKRFSLDQQQSEQQQSSEQNIYRSSMAILSQCPVQMNNNNNTSLTNKQIRDEVNNSLQQQQQQRVKTVEITREPSRYQPVDSHIPIEPTYNPQRASSRLTVFVNQHTASDLMDQTHADSTFSITSRNTDQPVQNSRHGWHFEQRKSIYASDSYLFNSSEPMPMFNRPFHSPTKNEHSRAKTPRREPSQDLIKSEKVSSKQNVIVYPKTSNESNRKQSSNHSSHGIYPLARTAMLHVANILMPSSYHRHSRSSHSKSRHHD